MESFDSHDLLRTDLSKKSVCKAFPVLRFSLPIIKMCKYCFKSQTSVDVFDIDDFLTLCISDYPDDPITGGEDPSSKV